MFLHTLKVIFVLNALASCVNSMKVFSFNSPTGDYDQLSKAVLINSPKQNLPEKFIFCFSMKQDKVDGKSPFLIRDRNNQPWIAVSIWKWGGFALWFEIGKSEWIKSVRVKTSVKFWSHICAGIDTITGNISVSMDGGSIMTRNSKMLTEDIAPKKLDQQLELGITETVDLFGGRQQFHGEISNIHFHLFGEQTSQLTMLSKDPCATKGNYLAWSDMTFSKIGPMVLELAENEDEVCDVLPESYNIFLPGKTSWTLANHLCEVLGGGIMAGVEDEGEMKRMVARMEGISKSCQSLWLPISDEREEGVWENTHTNSPAKYLLWNVGQPSGLEGENHVVMERETSAIRDVNIEELHCSSCTLKTNAVLTLRGGCKDSLLGKTISSRDGYEHQCTMCCLDSTMAL